MSAQPSTGGRGEVRTLRFLRWVFSDFYRMIRFSFRPDVQRFYASIGSDLMALDEVDFTDLERPLWLNQGYWKSSTTYPEAGAAMARLLAERAGLQPADEVLDVGFGFGEQDLIWAADYDLQKLYGINITPLQVEIARRRVEARGLEDTIRLAIGSATELPFSNHRFDKVLSLESAIHFDLREEFLAEAFRVLRPGGILAFTDLLPLPEFKAGGLKRKLARRMMFFPDGNLYPKADLIEKLSEKGFYNIICESISEYVFPGMSRFRSKRIFFDNSNEVEVHLTKEDIDACRGRQEYVNSSGVGDYVVVVAQKPAAKE